MKRKYIDLAFMVFMGYFALTQFNDGRTGYGILFAVLALMNMMTFMLKSKQEKAKENSETE